MKIGILTFHREINHGSALQAYCLYKLLEKWFPKVGVEIIDYLPMHTKKRRRCFWISKRFPFYSFNRGKLVKKHRQDRFLEKYTRISSQRITSDNCEHAISRIKSRKYDAIFVGSDTVWDTRKKGGAPAPPNVFFLPGLKGEKKMAFAASMDKGGPEGVSPEVWKGIISNINDFDFISVRDEATRNHIACQIISEERIHFMPDPTILYDFSKIVQYPAAFLESHHNLAGIGISDPKFQKAITQQLIKKGYEVINLLEPVMENQLTIPSELSFGERIGLYKGLKFLITDRFHGSIFALKLGSAPVFFIEPDYFYPKHNSKGRDLFNRIGLKDMVWRYESNKAIPGDLIEDALFISKSVKWSSIDRFSVIRQKSESVILHLKKTF